VVKRDYFDREATLLTTSRTSQGFLTCSSSGGGAERNTSSSSSSVQLPLSASAADNAYTNHLLMLSSAYAGHANCWTSSRGTAVSASASSRQEPRQTCSSTRLRLQPQHRPQDASQPCGAQVHAGLQAFVFEIAPNLLSLSLSLSLSVSLCLCLCLSLSLCLSRALSLSLPLCLTYAVSVQAFVFDFNGSAASVASSSIASYRYTLYLLYWWYKRNARV
jgi:hypothetical protein